MRWWQLGTVSQAGFSTLGSVDLMVRTQDVVKPKIQVKNPANALSSGIEHAQEF